MSGSGPFKLVLFEEFKHILPSAWFGKPSPRPRRGPAWVRPPAAARTPGAPPVAGEPAETPRKAPSVFFLFSATIVFQRCLGKCGENERNPPECSPERGSTGWLEKLRAQLSFDAGRASATVRAKHGGKINPPDLAGFPTRNHTHFEVLPKSASGNSWSHS